MIDSIKKSLENQTFVFDSSTSLMLKAIYSRDTIEGRLFWRILYSSYIEHRVFDYMTIINIYIRFGADVFQTDIHLDNLYEECFDKETKTITKESLEVLFRFIEHNCTESF